MKLTMLWIKWWAQEVNLQCIQYFFFCAFHCLERCCASLGAFLEMTYLLQATRGACNPNLNIAITNAFAAFLFLLYLWTSTKNAKNAIWSQAFWLRETYAKQQHCLQWHNAVEILIVQNKWLFSRSIVNEFWVLCIWRVVIIWQCNLSKKKRA